MNFNDRLENLIEEKNITQRDISTRLHIAATTLNGYVNNHREPDLDTLIRLAHYFDVSTDYLLGLTEDKKPVPSTLNTSEGRLIQLYRTLLPDKQEVMIELARFFQPSDNISQKSPSHREND